MDIEKKRMELDALGYELQNLKKLHVDLEKQMLKFDEVVPYERQTTAKIFSPRLLNIMLACGPQIESVTKLIAKRCGINLNDVIDGDGSLISKSVPKLINEINSKTVLSQFYIMSKIHDLVFTPFNSNVEWWKRYNDLKHGLSTNQFEINYTIVMDALAGLFGLYCIADKLLTNNDDEVADILDPKNWVSSSQFVEIYKSADNRYKISQIFYESSLFVIMSLYKPV